MTGRKEERLGNQQPSSCLERVEKVQRLGYTIYSICHDDETHRKRKTEYLANPKCPTPTEQSKGEDIVWSLVKANVRTMAKEMMEFTKNNILTQAAQAMLAQSNQMPQGVLQLLR